MNIFVDQNGIVVNEDIGFGFVNLAPFPQPNLNRSHYTLLVLLLLLLLLLLLRCFVVFFYYYHYYYWCY